jgi:hypothetical protein
MKVHKQRCHLFFVRDVILFIVSKQPRNLDISESRSEIPGRFEMWCWRRMEKIRWTDRVRNEEVLHTVMEERNILHTVNTRKTNLIGHFLRRHCLPKHVIEEG